MKKFMALYMASDETRESWKNMSEEDGKKGMEEWKKWEQDNKDSLVEFGCPLGKNKRVTAEGSTDEANDVCGYSIIQAESHDAAASIVESNPHVKMAGAYIEIMELMPMS